MQWNIENTVIIRMKYYEINQILIFDNYKELISKINQAKSGGFAWHNGL